MIGKKLKLLLMSLIIGMAPVAMGAPWDEEAKLVPGDGAASDVFGYSVSISGNTALVGAYGQDATATDAGAAYVYTRSGGTWTPTVKLLFSPRLQ